ncbi:uncharacterized protein LOC110983830 [Acanthaster planci]|uniref:Uncharacterized protein LOC110983830 n=1 Tax=Acanthaster planci TaxID=133434 RepID=A0A8B7Z702_ACAPL|nr:uncharacterized protein LOC110983830 [Acanthaster planci]
MLSRVILRTSKMRILHNFLVVALCSKVSLANGSVPVEESSWFVSEQRGVYEAVQHQVLASSVAESRLRCAKECLMDERCRQFCYGQTTGQCVLEDASILSGSGARANSCTYYTRQVCNSTYQLGRFGYEFPFPAFDDEFVLDFSVRASGNAKIAFSTDGMKENINYHLVIGQSSNTKTSIRRCQRCPLLYQVPVSGLLSEHEYQRFWLRYDHGVFALGKHGKAAYFEWSDPSPPAIPVWFVGFGSWDRPQEWVVYHRCI